MAFRRLLPPWEADPMQTTPTSAPESTQEDLLAELNNPPPEPMTRAEWILVTSSIFLGLVLLGALAWWVRTH